MVEAVAQILRGLTGLSEVREDALEMPKTCPAALVEWAEGEEDRPGEMGGPVTRRECVTVALVDRIGQGQRPGAVRDGLLPLGRAARAALRADPTLGGACLTSGLEQMQFEYVMKDGRPWAAVTFAITALVEES